MGLLFGALAALFLALGLAAIPMLRDAGPVERLGGRIGGVHEAVERTSVTAKLVEALADAARPAARAEPAGLAGGRRSSTSSTTPGARAG